MIWQLVIEVFLNFLECVFKTLGFGKHLKDDRVSQVACPDCESICESIQTQKFQ